MKQLIVTTITLFAYFACYAQDAKQQAKAYYFQAETMFNAGNYAKTVEFLDKSKQLLESSNASIEALLVKTHFQNKDYRKAKNAIDAFYTYQPSNQLQKQISPFLVQVNDKLQEVQEAERKKQTELQAYYQHYISEGNAASQKGEWEVAINSYAKALKYKPNDPYASKMIHAVKADRNARLKGLYISKGELAILEDDLNQAINWFQKALELVPGDTGAARRIKEVEALYLVLPKSLEKSGDIYFKAFHWREAKEEYYKSLKYQPENPHIRQRLKEISANADKGFKLADFTDPRDGNVYGVVQIGDQTWMSENMRYQTEGSACYDNYNENCSMYGRLYNRESSKKACPKGWKLPSEKDFRELINSRGDTYEQYSFLTSARSRFNATTGGVYDDGNAKPFDKFAFSPYIGMHWSSGLDVLAVFNRSISEWSMYKKMVRQSGTEAVHEMIEPGTVSINEPDGDVSLVKLNCRCIKRND